MGTREVEVGGLKLVKAIVWVIYAIATLAEIVIAFAFFLLLFDASSKASFVSFIYELGARFSQPFVGMIAPTKLGNGGVIAWSALFAIAAYAVAAWAIGSVLTTLSRSIRKKSAAPKAAPTNPDREAPVVTAPVAPASEPASPAPAEPESVSGSEPVSPADDIAAPPQ